MAAWTPPTTSCSPRPDRSPASPAPPAGTAATPGSEQTGTQLKITDVEAIPFAIPYRKPVRFASGEVSVADHVLVRVHTDEGLVGVAEAPPRPYTYGESQSSIVAAVREWFAPALKGSDPLARERVRALLNRTVGNHTAKGALDLALWDLAGQALGQPCSVLLGGHGTSMRVAHMVGFAPTAEMVEEAVQMRERFGVATFKVKVGRRPLEQDVQACRALRAALGSEVELYLDANRGWTGEEALRAVRLLAEVDPTLLEEPCPNDDVLDRRRVVQRSPIPVVGDESCTRLAEVARNLLDGMCSVVSIKTARTGFTESQRIVGLCEGLGVQMLIGNQVDGQLGSLAAVTFGAATASTSARAGELSNFLAMSDDLLAEPLQILDGRLAARERPGLGAELDLGKLAYYRTDGGAG